MAVLASARRHWLAPWAPSVRVLAYLVHVEFPFGFKLEHATTIAHCFGALFLCCCFCLLWFLLPLALRRLLSRRHL